MVNLGLKQLSTPWVHQLKFGAANCLSHLELLLLFRSSVHSRFVAGFRDIEGENLLCVCPLGQNAFS